MNQNESIKQILMRRDNMTAAEAESLIQDAFNAFHDYLVEDDFEQAYNVCEEYFGLEPDYIDELINT